MIFETNYVRMKKALIIPALIIIGIVLFSAAKKCSRIYNIKEIDC